MINTISVKGAKEHNLKNVSVEIPKGEMVVFTGISGSGKSSMAFDTIYAEGQRRYVESLSSYARQFLGVIGKPNADHIDGLSPAISIDQKTVSHNRRSTVGTITEIYDYFRLFFAKAGHPFCPNCGREITKLSVDEITTKMLSVYIEVLAQNKLKPLKITITSPVVRQRKGEFGGLFDNLRSKGFTKAIIDSKTMSLDTDILLIKTNPHTIESIIDEISATHKQMQDPVIKANVRSRMFGAVEQAVNLSNGLVKMYTSETDEHLFSENFSCPDCNISLPEIEPRMFSFNSPLGACETCRGLGTVIRINPKLVLSDNLTIHEGGILPFKNVISHDTWYARTFKTFLDDIGFKMNKPLNTLTKSQKQQLLYGSEKTFEVYGTNKDGRDTTIFEKFDGIIPQLEKKYNETKSDWIRHDIEKFMTEEVCESCMGMRLKNEVLHVKLDGLNIFEVCEMPITKTRDFVSQVNSKLSEYEQNVAKMIISEISARLKFLEDVGLGYLTLNRTARTLSGGESQRIRLASQIGSGLSGVIYVLDEPSIGLHPKDVESLVESLKGLRDIGNSMIVVEHDTETIMNADYIVDFGPKAGSHGGQVVFQGPLKDFEAADTLTADYLFGRKSIAQRSTKKLNSGKIILKGARQFNLKGVTAEFPLGHLIGVTGVSGSGKSTLIVETLHKAMEYYVNGKYDTAMGEFDSIDGYQYIDKVYLVDQSPIGKTPRSNPATYVGAFDFIRDIFAQTPDAKMRGYKKGRFSFNVKGGRCEKCAGAGSIKVEMQFLPDVYVTCDVCNGMRYNSETLEVKYKGKSIYDVLQLTIEESIEFFAHHKNLHRKLQALNDIGLSYLELGRPAPTLSGGEAQRVKLADELARSTTGRTMYILDEPTTGLHLYDINKLLKALYALVDNGNTVIVIEHNLDVIKNTDYIIDLGPEGGEGGGEILYQGSAKDIVKDANSATGKFLSKELQ